MTYWYFELAKHDSSSLIYFLAVHYVQFTSMYSPHLIRASGGRVEDDVELAVAPGAVLDAVVDGARLEHHLHRLRRLQLRDHARRGRGPVEGG